jgi:hypothetical protein
MKSEPASKKHKDIVENPEDDHHEVAQADQVETKPS